MKTLRAHLEARYAAIDRVVKPVWIALWLAAVALMVTPLRWWAGVPLVIVWTAGLIAVARIRCPRCEKRIGLLAQPATGGRGLIRAALRNIECPHCGLGLDDPC